MIPAEKKGERPNSLEYAAPAYERGPSQAMGIAAFVLACTALPMVVIVLAVAVSDRQVPFLNFTSARLVYCGLTSLALILTAMIASLIALIRNPRNRWAGIAMLMVGLYFLIVHFAIR